MGAQIRATIGGPAAAQIQVIPTDRGMELLPGTMVHVFYLDTDDPGFDQAQDDGEGVGTQDASQAWTSLSNGESLSSASRNKFYKLIFSGEVCGFHFVKQPSSRSLILQCLDSSKHWDTVYQYMLDFSMKGEAAGDYLDNSANFTGFGKQFTTTGEGDEITSQLAALLVEGGPKTPGLTEAQGLLGGLIRLLETVGGVVQETRGVNDYTTIAELMVKNLFQIAADSDDDSALQLLDEKVFESMLTQTLQQMGGRVSMRDIIRVMNSIIFHNIAPNPAPYYTQGTTTASSISYDFAAEATLTAPERLHPRLVTFWDALNGMTPPPGVRYVAGNSTRSASDQQKVFRKGHSKARPGQSPHNYDKSLALDVYAYRGTPEKISNDPADYQAIGKLAQEQGLTWGGGWTSFVDMPHVQIAGWRASIGSSSQTGLIEDEDKEAPEPSAPLDLEITDEDKRRTSRLLTQVFRPDIWYVPPPRCNVIFPENYSSFSYSRNFLQEITRLQLRTGSELLGQTGITQDYYYAPMIEALQKELKTNGQLEGAFLLPHEKFTGIIPEIQSMQDVGFYLKSILEQKDNNDDKDKFAGQVAAFNFFKSRFAPRTMTVSGGHFTPMPVVGFPAVVMQRGLPPIPEVPTSRILQMINDGDQTIEQGFLIGENRTYMPTQFLGMVESVNHNITQAGGTTSLSLTHVRTHRSADGQDDEFLNHMIGRQETQTTKVEVTTSLQASSLLESQDFEKLRIIGQVTPQGDNPTMSRTGSGGLWTVGSTGPQGGKITRIETSGQLLHKGYAKTLDQTEFSQHINYYSEVKIVEEVDSTSSQAADIKAANIQPPVEMVLAPPWVSDLYGNDQIGEGIYQPFFGTGSIVDEQTFRVRDSILPGSGSSTPDKDLFTSSNEGEIGALSDFGTPTEIAAGETLGLIHSRRQEDAQQSFAAPPVGNTVQSSATPNTDPQRSITLEEMVEARLDISDSVARPISIAQAVDTLSTIYGSLKAQEVMDVHRFIHRYTYRPIASMDEVLGHPDFSLDAEGNPVRDDQGEVVGFEGFHSRAVSDLGQLQGLLTNPDILLKSESGEDAASIDPEMDPRPGRRARVVRYISELTGLSGSKGLLG